MKVFLLLPLLLASASANLRPFGGPEDAQQEAVSDDYALPPRLTRQPLVPSQYFLNRGRFGLLAPTISVPVSTNAGGAAPSVRSPLLAGVGEALNGLTSDGDDHNNVSNEDRRGGFNVVKETAKLSHSINDYFRQDPFRGGAKYHLDLCFYLGDDVKQSHVMCNARWNNDTAEGWAQYVNDLGFETERILNRVDEKWTANYDFELRWAGPWYRKDYDQRYPAYAPEDTKAALASGVGCDIVVFLVFNEFKTCEGGGSDGHQFSGIAEGGACEGTYGSGYVIAVDQGYLGEHWVGPQVLAHHLLLVMTQDLYAVQGSKEKRGCLNKKSILHESVYPGDQWRDACVQSKLRRSQIAKRECLLNPNYCPNCPYYLDKQDF